MEKAYQFLRDKFIKISNPTVIVACSGGPDSMALLQMCIDLKKHLELEIICAHVNHNVREESESEKLFVENFCKRRHIKFEYMKITNYGDDNFENEAREKRYRFFNELVQKYQASYLLTAHHGDDLIETILMRIARGSTLKGYSGFLEDVKKDNYHILRPFIFCTKDQLIEYNREHGIEFVVDKTNHMDVHTRNRYRKYILPKLKEEDKNIHKKFYKFSRTLLECSEFVKEQIRLKKNEVYHDGKIKVDEFLKLDDFLGNKLLEDILEEYYQDDLFLISTKHVELLRSLVTSSKANAVVCLPNNVRAVKAYDILYFSIEEEKNFDYEVELCESVTLQDGKVIHMSEDTLDNSNSVCRLDSTEVSLPLIVRNRRDGDKMQVKGMDGTKKIKDIFIDEKVSLDKRNSWPIVTDSQNRIVWLPGLKKSQFDKKKSQKYDIIVKYD